MRPNFDYIDGILGALFLLGNGNDLKIPVQ